MQEAPHGHLDLRCFSQRWWMSMVLFVTFLHADGNPEEVSGSDPQYPLSRGDDFQASFSQWHPFSVPYDSRSLLTDSFPMC